MTAPDPIFAAIRDHREAWDAFQIAPEGEPAIDANCAMCDALDALVLIACAFPILTQPLPEGTAELLGHLRWWLGEEAEFAADYQPEYGILQARAADLSAVLEPAASELDPILAAINEAVAADDALTVINQQLNEDDEPSMCRHNVAAHRSVTTKHALERVIPTTGAGVLALARYYSKFGEDDDGFAHLVKAMLACESSGTFGPRSRPIDQSHQLVARAIPQADFQASDRVAA